MVITQLNNQSLAWFQRFGIFPPESFGTWISLFDLAHMFHLWVIYCWCRKNSAPVKLDMSFPTISHGFFLLDEPSVVYLRVVVFGETPLKINGWFPKITQLTRKIIFQTSIFPLHVNFQGCNFCCWCWGNLFFEFSRRMFSRLSSQAP